ncbi:DNA-binding protein [Pedobacter frigoris]|uniref:DNA-binding protein n=1 Tax=Pedobacter frigoris TaxID=2571272 RepID=UPI0029313128|nr:DNA-binding protein [Pedobacter frigoris]
MECVTKDDLRMFRMQLLNDIKQLLTSQIKEEITEQKKWVKGHVVKARLEICASTLQNYRVAGILKGKKIKGSWFYCQEDIDALFNKGRGS